MPFYKQDQVRGFRYEGKIYCSACYGDPLKSFEKGVEATTHPELEEGDPYVCEKMRRIVGLITEP